MKAQAHDCRGVVGGGKGVSLWIRVCPTPSPWCWSEIKQTFLSISIASLSGFEPRAAGPCFQLQFLVPMWGCCILTTWCPSFPAAVWPWWLPRRASRSPLVLSWLAGPRRGFGWMFLTAAETVCFQEPPCFSPCSALAANWCFSLVEWKDASGSSKPSNSTGVYPLTSLLSTEGHLGFLLVDSDLCLTLRPVKGLPVSTYFYLFMFD